MNLDVLLIKLFLQDTSLWLKYGKYVNRKSNNLFTKVYHVLAKLKEDGNVSHTTEQLVAAFHVAYPVISSTELEILESTISQVVEANPQGTQITELLQSLKERKQAEDIALKAVEVASGSVAYSELLESCLALVDDSDTLGKDETDFVPDDLSVIADHYNSSASFKFRLKTLNSILGGLHRRSFGFIFARPEVGKTQFLASEATFLAQQANGCVLWINNEEDGIALITRCYQATLGVDSATLFKDTAAARDKYNAIIKGRIKIYDKPAATARDIESVIRDTVPDVVFIDQLDKVKGIDGERYDLKQKALYQWARELAKRYNCAIIGVCQAGGTAEGKKYLDMNDVDSSHTSKQGEADWMCGIGVSDRIGDEDKRFLSFCKNKLPVTPLMKTEMRHAKVPIRSRPEIQIYEDVINV